MSNRRYVFSHGKRIEVETLDTGIEAKVKAKRRHRFVKVPLTWVDQLRGAGGITYEVAIHILWKAWSRRAYTVKLPQIPGVSRCGKRAALRKLELAGLISVDRRPDKSPMVTVLGVCNTDT
jgi:hypothetical protein